MVALQRMLESGKTITQDYCASVMGLADQYLQRTVDAAGAFSASEFRPALIELPQYCCSLLVAEVRWAATAPPKGAKEPVTLLLLRPWRPPWPILWSVSDLLGEQFALVASQQDRGRRLSHQPLAQIPHHR